MKRRRGLTIIELLVALFMTFLSVCTLAAVLVSSYEFLHRIQDRSMVYQLARLNLDEGLSNGTATQYASYPNFTISLSWWNDFPAFDPVYDGQMKNLVTTVKSPNGQSMELETAYRDLHIGGICMSDTGMVGYGVYKNGNSVRIFDDVAKAQVGGDYPFMPVRRYSQPGNQPIAGVAGGMTTDANFTVMYVSDIADGGEFQISNPATYRGWPGDPSDFSSISTVWDLTANLFWGTDSDNHDIFSSNLGSTSGTGYYPKSGQIQLDCPSIMAQDPVSRDLWVADEGMLCLRHCTLGGVWEPYEYKPPVGQHMGIPRGIAFTRDGNLDVCDGANLWVFTGKAAGVLTGRAYPLPAALVGQIHALCAPRGYTINDVWFTNYQDELWKFDASSGNFTHLN